MGKHKATCAGGVPAGTKVQHRGSTLSPSLSYTHSRSPQEGTAAPPLSCLIFTHASLSGELVTTSNMHNPTELKIYENYESARL